MSAYKKSLFAIAALVCVEIAVALIAGDAFADARWFTAYALLVAIASQLPFVRSRMAGKDGSDISPAKGVSWRAVVAVSSFVGVYLAWLLFARPATDAAILAFSEVLFCLLAIAIGTAWRRAPREVTYGRCGVPIAVCCAALLVSIAVSAYVTETIGPSNGVLLWTTGGTLTSAIVALLAVRERYMASKARRLESGRALPIGIDPPRRPIGSRILLGLCAIPVLLVVLGIASLPWGLRALSEVPVVETWASSELGGRWVVESIIKIEGSYYFDEESVLVYVIAGGDDDRRAVEVDFPGLPRTEIGDKSKAHLVDMYLDAGMCEVSYLLGNMQPVIDGFCELPDEESIFVDVIWRRQTTS